MMLQLICDSVEYRSKICIEKVHAVDDGMSFAASIGNTKVSTHGEREMTVNSMGMAN